jgi:hypothetical protein
VTASQRDPDNFATAPNSGANEYLADLQTAAQNSVGALKQEAGTFTPALQGSGTAGTWAYTTQLGTYIRIGNMVFFKLRVKPSSISGSPTGNLQITGLPYTSESTTDDVFTVMVTGVNWGTSMTQIKGFMTKGTSTIEFYGQYNNGAWAVVPVGNILATDDIIIRGEYQITP